MTANTLIDSIVEKINKNRYGDDKLFVEVESQPPHVPFTDNHLIVTKHRSFITFKFEIGGEVARYILNCAYIGPTFELQGALRECDVAFYVDKDLFYDELMTNEFLDGYFIGPKIDETAHFSFCERRYSICPYIGQV